MKFQNTAEHETLSVRPLETRDLKRAGETFPGARVHVHAGPADSLHGSIEELASGRQCAWVAEAAGRIIAMAVVSIENQTLAHLTFLHAIGNGADRQRAARALAEVAIRDVWEQGCLKLIVHPRIPVNQVIEYMHKLGFEHARTRSSGSERVVEFYVNLYERPRNPSPGAGDI